MTTQPAHSEQKKKNNCDQAEERHPASKAAGKTLRFNERKQLLKYEQQNCCSERIPCGPRQPRCWPQALSMQLETNSSQPSHYAIADYRRVEIFTYSSAGRLSHLVFHGALALRPLRLRTFPQISGYKSKNASKLVRNCFSICSLLPSSTCIVTWASRPLFSFTVASPTSARSSAGKSRIPYTSVKFAIHPF